MAYLVKEYKIYAKKVHKILTEGPAPPGETMEHVGLVYHPRGLPKVPAEVLNNRNTETCIVQKRLIRLYINKHYELAGGKGAAPYGRITTAMSKGVEMFAAEYWPPGVPFQEPGSYKTAQTNAILRYWRKREKQGQIPFKFSSIITGSDPVSANYLDDLFELEPPPTGTKGLRKFTQRRNKRNRTSSDSDSEDIKSNDNSMNLESEDKDVEQPPESQEPTPSIGGDDIHLTGSKTRMSQRDGDRTLSSSENSERMDEENTPPPTYNDTEGTPTLHADSEPDDKAFGGGDNAAGPPNSDISETDLPTPNAPIQTRKPAAQTGGKAGEKGKGKVKVVSQAAVPRQTRAQVAKQAPPTKGTRSQTRAKQ